MWLAALPLLFVPACWLYWAASGEGLPAVMIARSAALLIAVGCVFAAFPGRAPRTSAVIGTERLTRRGRVLEAIAHPGTWCAAALAWQLAVWAVAAPVREPGLPWLAERTGAWVAALGLASWLAGTDLPRVAWGLAGAGAATLVLAAVGQQACGGGTLAETARIGWGGPFGLANFNVGGALPLLGVSIGLWLRERQSRPQRWFHVFLALGWSAAIVLGLGLNIGADGVHLGDATRSVWVGFVVMACMALALCAPMRLQMPLVALGVVALALGEIGVTVGWLPLEHAAPSTLQRVYLWQSAWQAIDGGSLLGYGPGAVVAALPEQPSFALAWLAVPSYAEHAHNEVLEILMDGGAVSLAFIACALWTTLWPLWRRRSESLPFALLVSWSGVITHALIECHLSQPGPLFLLALLAGVSWACAREGIPVPEPSVRVRIWRRVGCLSAAAAIVTLCAIDLLRWSGSPAELQERADPEFVRLERAKDWVAYRDAARALRGRVGPLVDLAFREAYAEAHLGRDGLARAESLALEQAERLPLLASNLDLLERLRRHHEMKEEFDQARTLRKAIEHARERCRELLATVPENDKNRPIREALATKLGPAP